MKEGRERNASETVRVMAAMTVILMPAAIIIEKHDNPSSALGAEYLSSSHLMLTITPRRTLFLSWFNRLQSLFTVIQPISRILVEDLEDSSKRFGRNLFVNDLISGRQLEV